jgi:hypothetical protein
MNIRYYPVIIFIAIQICFAPLFAYEMRLINGDYRLAAVGNLDLIIEASNNEINGYDFGESPAGIIDDDNGNSQVYIPGMYSFTKFADDLDSWKRHGTGFSLKTIFKKPSQFALGNSFSHSNAVVEYDISCNTYNNYYDTIFVGYKINSNINIGFRGSYYKATTKQENGYVTNDETDAYSYEPSFFINPIGEQWQLGVNYRLRKYSFNQTSHKFLIPIIYSSINVQCGLKVHLETMPHDSPEMAFEFRSTYLIPFGQKQLKFALLCKGIKPYHSEEYYYTMIRGFGLNIGSGIACLDENIGLIGIQYNIVLYKTDPSFWNDENSQAVYEHYLNLGAEFYLIKHIPLRLGYVIITTNNDYYNPTYSIITSGFGLKILNSKLAIDFVYNFKVMEYSGFEYSEKNHIFGLSSRFIF